MDTKMQKLNFTQVSQGKMAHSKSLSRIKLYSYKNYREIIYESGSETTDVTLIKYCHFMCCNAPQFPV